MSSAVKLPRSDTPRFPNSAEEAALVYEQWDRLNGRYYFMADVVLENGERLLVTFDSDSNIAVQVGGLPVAARFYLAVIRQCRVRDRNTARPRGLE